LLIAACAESSFNTRRGLSPHLPPMSMSKLESSLGALVLDRFAACTFHYDTREQDATDTVKKSTLAL
jgi:hypothetical protein